ncbi:uncharacterized protein LOC113107252 [Carassius auratus]|uniref:Uncharacterized protein LOC113107252 n=1 Tax=Carassius auratus TaxID=7957 RepID=A0A6P6PV59_CARAU|nr:uncharacterized protein LOC113107252 [Carassius auratus]
MTRSGAFKLSIVFFLTLILCLPEFFPEISQIKFICELFDPCTPENDAQVCTPDDPPCVTEKINGSSQHTHEDWYLCKTEIDLQLLYNNTSESGMDVKVVLAMKSGNLSGWNISVFAFLNNTDLYTGPQNDQRLFSCYLPPDDSKCPDLNITLHENTSTPTQDTSILKTITPANPATSSPKTTTLSFQATASTDELKCQPNSSSFLFYYQQQNETARSAALSATKTRKAGRWCVITSVWFALVLTVVVVTLVSVGSLIFKSRKQRKSHLATSVPDSTSGHQFKELRKQKGNLMRDAPDVSIAICSISDGGVFSQISSVENRTNEHLLKVDDIKRRLSPIYEITDSSLDEEEKNEDEEEGHCNVSITKEEFKNSNQLQHQGNCEPPTYLHHRSFSCSCHEDDVEL